MSNALPSSARVVVIGGGVIGCSVAYHLAHMGVDVVLLERDRVTSGTTWHAAGLMVTFGSFSETSTEMRKYTRDLYARLEAETGLATGFNPVGFIEVACEPDRLEEYRRVSAFNRYCGVNVQEISPREVKELFPLARVDDILAGFYVKEDGKANPVDVTMALAKGAKNAGARIFENTPVVDVLHKRGAVTGVRTAQGDIACEVVVNCAGMWARQLGAKSGITIPNQSSVAMAYKEFEDNGRMKPSAYYDRVVDVMEELVKFTLLTRSVSDYLVDRYSERKEAQPLNRRRTT